jgi:hypothetical protein
MTNHKHHRDKQFSKTDLRRDCLIENRREWGRIVPLCETDEPDDLLFDVKEEEKYVQEMEEKANRCR